MMPTADHPLDPSQYLSTEQFASLLRIKRESVAKRQRINAEAKRLAHALRDLTPTYPRPCGTKAIRPLTTAYFDALKRGLALGHAEVIERQQRAVGTGK